MKFLQSFLAIIIGLIIVFYNVGKIPNGSGMGAIVLIFTAFVIFIFSFVIYVLVSLLIWKKKSKYQAIIQIPLFIAFLTLTYLSSWKVCVYSKPEPTEKELLAEQYEQYKTLKKYYYTIPYIIKNGQTFRPSKKIASNDSLLLLNSMKDLLSIKSNDLDSISELKLIGLFYKNSTIRPRNNEDSLSINKQHKLINQSLKIRNLFYSPDHRKILIFVSYKTNQANRITLGFNGSGKSFALMAFKSGNKMVVFNYYNIDYSYGFIKNDNIAYSLCFQNLIGDSDHGKYAIRDNFLSSEYWNSVSMTKKLDLKNKMHYELHFVDKHGEKFKFEKPIYTLKTK